MILVCHTNDRYLLKLMISDEFKRIEKNEKQRILQEVQKQTKINFWAWGILGKRKETHHNQLYKTKTDMIIKKRSCHEAKTEKQRTQGLTVKKKILKMCTA